MVDLLMRVVLVVVAVQRDTPLEGRAAQAGEVLR
jgi:hypothetical protein